MIQRFVAVLAAVLLATSLVAVGAVPAAADGHGDRTAGAEDRTAEYEAGTTGYDLQTVECTYPFSAEDMTGTNVTIEEPAEEVVALDAASAQTFWEIGAEAHVVGMPVKDYTAYLDGSEERTDVLTAEGQVEVETVVELDPDVVVAPNFTPEETVRQLRDAGLTVYQFEMEDSLEAIYAKTRLAGAVVDECEAADRTVEETRSEVEEIREAVGDRDEPRVLYYFFGVTAGSGTFIDEVIDAAGGRNIAAEEGVEGFQQISAEVVAERDPEWIVSPDDPGAFDPEAEPFPETAAVQRNQTMTVDADLISQAGPRVVVPMRAMAEAFHPDAFDEETPTSTPESEPDTPTAESDTATPEPETPGFGIGAALLAVLATALLGARRDA